MTTVRPIRETIPLDEARALILDAVVPIERTERVPLARGARPRARATRRVHRRRAAVRSRGDGRLRGARRGHVRRRPLRAGKTSAASRTVFTGQVPRERVTRGECIEIATGAPMPPAPTRW